MGRSSSHSRPPPSLISLRLLPFILPPLCLLPPSSAHLEAFPFSFSLSEIRKDHLTLSGNAAVKHNGLLTLTRRAPHSYGRFFLKDAMPLLGSSDFSTSFRFVMYRCSARKVNSTGGRLSFLIAFEADEPPLNSGGGHLGYFNESFDQRLRNGMPFALQFNTFMDEESGDPKGLHVGVHIGSLTPLRSVDLTSVHHKRKASRRFKLKAWIDYHSQFNLLEVFLSKGRKILMKPPKPVLSVSIDFSTMFRQEAMFIGFSAATGSCPSQHAVTSWNLSVEAIPSSVEADEQISVVSGNDAPSSYQRLSGHEAPSCYLSYLVSRLRSILKVLPPLSPASLLANDNLKVARFYLEASAPETHIPSPTPVYSPLAAPPFVLSPSESPCYYLPYPYYSPTLVYPPLAAPPFVLSPSESPCYYPPYPYYPGSQGRKSYVVIVLSILAVVIVFLAVIFGVMYARKRRDSSSNPNAHFEMQVMADAPRSFLYKDLSRATQNFSSEVQLGQGGFGSVYKGILQDGSVVAIKKISDDSKQGVREFQAEVQIIGRLRHRNLVVLRGWCCEKGKMLLVYDFMPNGSLDKVLHDRNANNLSWEHRFNAIDGVAAAIAFLHEGWEQRVLHRDVKASNVMLDANFNARLGDFGLARLVEHGRLTTQTMTAAGTFGYAPPEVVYTGKTTEKSDVYSFGVLALEVATGRHPLDPFFTQMETSLVYWVWGLNERMALLEAADSNLAGNFNEEKMRCVLHIGLLCCNPSPGARPSMRYVCQILKGDIALPVHASFGPVPSFPVPSDIQQTDMPSASTREPKGSSSTFSSEAGALLPDP